MTAPLQARGLTRRFGDDLAVDNVDLSVDRGEIHAIVGLNGAGKTTLMRLLLGMLQPDHGQARILGDDAQKSGPETWRQVGHLIETPFAYPELTVKENVTASALLGGLSPYEATVSTERVIDQFELNAWAERRAAVKRRRRWRRSLVERGRRKSHPRTCGALDLCARHRIRPDRPNCGGGRVRFLHRLVGSGARRTAALV